MNIGQLTFDVKPHPEALGDMRIVGSLTIKGALPVPCDLDHGDLLLVTVSGPDGEVLTSCQAMIAAPPSFVPIEDKDLGLLGYERAHRAKLTD